MIDSIQIQNFISLTEALVLLSLLIQQLEFGSLASWFKTFGPKKYYLILALNLVFILVFIVSPYQTEAVLGLLIVFLLQNIFFEGPFNGGSDSITFYSLLGLLLMSVESLALQKTGLLLMAVVSLTSYALAGFYKLKSKSWRQGTALSAYHESGYYNLKSIFKILNTALKQKLFCWLTVAVEILAPVFILNGPKPALLFIGLSFFFHLSIYKVFKLNRFFWAWIATYPSLLYLSLYLKQL